MRRYQKKRLKEKFQYLHDGHQLIAESLVSNRNISSLLTECQKIAIEIGNGIEECEGAGTKAVTILEQYCELLYSFSVKTLKTKSVNYAVSVKRKLEEVISEAEKSIEQDIIVKTEVVFFPYKASMWDSMETVWRGCKEDNNTRCIVVPLPYYIKDGNGKKVKKCYEGADFPAEVEITDYEQYLKENHYSDIAIYHNPYDAINKITEVDSRFFTSEYHKYADTLVYIPYYVLIYEPSAGFILAPGVKNADYVILQDNETVNAFLKWYPNQQNKFLPLGSPKIEKAIQMNAVPREELDIPQEWKDRIRGKKVLFYNTHLVNFMDKKRDFTGKLKSVFETMQKQEDIVLWWRPHPLSEDMEYSTNMERFREYEELVEWYRSENIGIYDDTPKLHEAIAASDAYYGDGSSLVKLFQAVDKPVMVQNVKNCDENLVSCSIVEDNQIWISAPAFNAFFCWDMDKNRISYEGHFAEEALQGAWSENAYMQIYYIRNRLVFIPYNAMRGFAVYDMEKKITKRYQFDIRYDVKFVGLPFYGSAEENGKVYEIICYQTVADVFCYDIESGRVEKLKILTQHLQELRHSNNAGYAIAAQRDCLYVLEVGTDLLVEYNIETKKCRNYNLSEYDSAFRNIAAVDCGIFLISGNDIGVICQRIDDNLIMEHVIWETEEKACIYRDSSLKSVGNKVYAFSNSGEVLVCYDLEYKRKKCFKFDYIQENLIGFCIDNYNNKIYLHSCNCNRMFVMDLDTGYVNRIEVCIDEIILKLMKDMQEEQKCIIENVDWTLKKYLSML